MTKLGELCARCKYSVSIEFNAHRDYYQTVEQYLEENDVTEDDLDSSIRNEMITKDTIVRIQCYTISACGFYLIYHHDVDQAINIALETLNNDAIPKLLL